MSNDYWQTMLNKQNRLIDALRQVYIYALISHYNTNVMSEKINAIRQKAEYRKSPNHIKSYFEGYQRALYDNFMRNEIISGYYWQGNYYITPNSWNSMPEELKEIMRSNKPLECKMYYKNSFKNGVYALYCDDNLLNEARKARENENSID